MSQIIQLVRGQSIDLRKDTRVLRIATSRVISGGAGVASALATTGAAVNVSASDPPTVGQILIATSATAATWQDAPGGGGGGGTLNDAYDFSGPGAGRVIVADSGALEVVTNGIGEGATVSIRAINNDPAIDGTQQHSPAYEWVGKGFATGPDASQDTRMVAQLQPIQGVANPTAKLQFGSNINGGGLVDALAIEVGVGVDARLRMPAPVVVTGNVVYGFFGVDSGFFYNRTTDALAIKIVGVTRWLVDGNQLQPTSIGTAAGVAIAASNSDVITGLFSPGTNRYAVGTMALKAMEWDASQNTIFTGNAQLGLNQRLIHDDDGDTYTTAEFDDQLRMYVGGLNVVRFVSTAMSLFGFQQMFRNVNAAISGTASRGLELITLVPATVGDPVKNSPRMTWTGSSWNTVGLVAEGANVVMQMRTTSGPTTTGALHFRGMQGGAGEVEIGFLTSAGALSLEEGIGLHGNAPAAQSPAYVVTNPSADRAFDASSATLAEVRNVLGTVIADLQSPGLFG